MDTKHIIGTAYEVIAKVNGLEHYKDDMYKTASGDKKKLDRFGFHPTVVTAYKMLYKDLQKLYNTAMSSLSSARKERDEFHTLLKLDNNANRLLAARKIINDVTISDKEKVKSIGKLINVEGI